MSNESLVKTGTYFEERQLKICKPVCQKGQWTYAWKSMNMQVKVHELLDLNNEST